MNARRGRQLGSIIAGITTVVYFGLVCLAATCSPAVPTASSHGGHEHHDHDATHSPLCVWACQVTSEGGLVASAPAEGSDPVSITSVAPLVEPRSAFPSPSLRSRAPPIPTLG
jgi:hypothetical protein